MGHDMFKIMLKSSNSMSAAATTQMTEWLLDGPDVVVIDEAHVMKAKKSDICLAVSKIKTKRRIALTGSPLQNNLFEYYVMVNWIRKGYLAPSEAYFRKMFFNPIKAGECKDASDHEKKYMNRRSHVLHKKLSSIVDRKDITTLEKDLPPKREFVILVRMSGFQKYLYKRFLELDKTKKTGASKLFVVYQSLLRLWNHPGVTVLKSLQQDAKEEDDANKLQEQQRSAGKKQKRINPVVSETAKLKNLSTPIDRLRRELMRPVRAFEGLAEEAKEVDLSELVDLIEVILEPKENAEENDEDPDEEDDNMSFIEEDAFENAGHFQSSYEHLLEDRIVVDDEKKSESPNSLQMQLLEDDDDDEGEEISGEKKRPRTGGDLFTAPKSDFEVSNMDVSVAPSGLECGVVVQDACKEHAVSVLPSYWPRPQTSPFEGQVADTDNWTKLLNSVECDSMEPDAPIESAFASTHPSSDAIVDLAPVSAEELADEEEDVEDSSHENEDADLSPELKYYWKLEHLLESSSSSSSSSNSTESLSELEFLLLGNKLFVLLAILKASIDAGDKVLVFSSSIPTLDLIEHCLKLTDWGSMLPNSPVSSGFLFSNWKLGKQFARIDGTFDSEKRLKQIDAFNDKRVTNHHKVFLLSTKAANMGKLIDT